ncbi:hypothetical protein K1W54_22495 [Micromonospora sp. CPCC 205371]|nr:hypothetical protein [Micromonospora sp. CPCC 205371]
MTIPSHTTAEKPFHTMDARSVRAVVEASRPEIVACVRDTYLAHERGETICLNSQFLRFPEKPNARIIALPAFVREPRGVAGIKWISSFPDNLADNLPRAPAVLLPTASAPGSPSACPEAAQTSAARTAAPAALAAEALHGARTAGKVAVVGAGVISRTVVEFLRALDWSIVDVAVFDTVPAYAEKSARHIASLGYRAAHRGRGILRRRPDRPEHLAARHRAGHHRGVTQHRGRRRALPERGHLAAPGGAEVRAPRLHRRHHRAASARRRQGQPGPAARLLAVRARRARRRGRPRGVHHRRSPGRRPGGTRFLRGRQAMVGSRANALSPGGGAVRAR